MFTRKRIIITAGVAVLAVLGILVGIFAGLNSHKVADHKSVKNEKFESLVEGLTAPNGLPPNGMVVIPASEDNWYGMFPYASRISYLGMPYAIIGEGATYLMSISANGTNDDEALVVGSFKYPVMGVVYESEREADQAKERAMLAMTAEPELTDAKFFTKGNILYFVLQATFTDDQMSVESLPSSLTEDDLRSWGVDEGEAYWYVSFDAFISSYKETLEDERYGEGVDKILAKAGITPDTYWVGTSKDLEVWDGKIYNIDISSITPKDFISYFSNFYKKVTVEDRTEWEYFSILEPAPDQYDYEIAAAQSVLSQYTEVATKKGVAGMLDLPSATEEVTSEEIPEDELVNGERGGSGEYEQILERIPSDSPYALKVLLDPNSWLGYLRGGEVLQAPRLIYVKTLLAEIKPNGEARLTIDPYTMDEYFEELAKTEAGADEFAQQQETVNSEAGLTE